MLAQPSFQSMQRQKIDVSPNNAATCLLSVSICTQHASEVRVRPVVWLVRIVRVSGLNTYVIVASATSSNVAGLAGAGTSVCGVLIVTVVVPPRTVEVMRRVTVLVKSSLDACQRSCTQNVAFTMKLTTLLRQSEFGRLLAQ